MQSPSGDTYVPTPVDAGQVLCFEYCPVNDAGDFGDAVLFEVGSVLAPAPVVEHVRVLGEALEVRLSFLQRAQGAR